MNISTEMTTNLQKKSSNERRKKNRRTRSISAVKIIFLLCFEHRYSLHVLLLLLILLLISFYRSSLSLSLRLSSHNCTKIFFNDVPLQALTLSHSNVDRDYFLQFFLNSLTFLQMFQFFWLFLLSFSHKLLSPHRLRVRLRQYTKKYFYMDGI